MRTSHPVLTDYAFLGDGQSVPYEDSGYSKQNIISTFVMASSYVWYQRVWYGAFGLLVTLIWLCIETLRLLGRLKKNANQTIDEALYQANRIPV
jgi:hypothetical protein